MSEHPESEIQTLLALTVDLLAHARNGEWEEAGTVEARRRPLLYRVLGQDAPGAGDQRPQVLNELISVDCEVMRLAQERREELSKLIQRAAQNRGALRAYETNR